MKVTRQSLISGETRTREIDITMEQYTRWLTGVLIQDVVPHLSLSDREFLISGSTDEEWDELLPPDEEEDPLVVFLEKAEMPWNLTPKCIECGGELSFQDLDTCPDCMEEVTT